MAIKIGNRLKPAIRPGRLVIAARKFMSQGKAHRIKGRLRRGRS